MALSDKLSEHPARLNGKPCSVRTLLERLPGKEHDALDSMLYELHWSGARIHEVLTEEGYEVGRQTINRHRANQCGCYMAPK